MGNLQNRLAPIKLSDWTSINYQTPGNHLITGLALNRSHPKSVVILPGLFADSQSMYARWVAQLIDTQTKYNVILLDGFANHKTFETKPFPMGLGKSEAVALNSYLHKVAADSALIAFSYGGSVALHLQHLTRWRHLLLINPMINPLRCMNQLSNLPPIAANWFASQRRKLLEQCRINTSLSFQEAFHEYFLPRCQEFLATFHPPWASIECPANPWEQDSFSCSVIAADTDPVVHKRENAGQLLSLINSTGIYYDTTEGFHTQFHLTHPQWFAETILHEISSKL